MPCGLGACLWSVLREIRRLGLKNMLVLCFEVMGDPPVGENRQDISRSVKLPRYPILYEINYHN